RERLRAAAARPGAGDAIGVWRGTGAPAGTLAFLFPGQGAQAPGVGRELATYLPDLRDEVAAMDAVTPIARRLWPPAAFTDAARDAQRHALAATAVAQPAIGALSAGLLDLLRRLGVEPAAVAGHSYGEFVALHAAGSLDRASLRTLSAARGRAMAAVGGEAGAMAMAGLSATALAPYLGGRAVVIANHNAPSQTVVSGPAADLADLVAALRADGHTAVPLQVSGAFHSPLMTPARPALAAAIRDVAFTSPAIPVHANLDGAPYPADPPAIAARLVEHLEQPVHFIAQVESLYASGVRTFLEVGPGKVLCGLVTRILGARPHQALPTDGGMTGLLGTCAALFVAGHAVDVARLFDGRGVSWADLDRLPAAPPAPQWFLDGAHVWEAGATSHTSGVAPFLDADTAALAPRVAGAAPPLDGIVLSADAPAGSLVEVYREYERTMRHFLDQQERMLARVLGGEDGAPLPRVSTAGEARTRPAPETAGVRPLAALDVSRDGLAARLVRIVGDRTGYGDEAIGGDLDLEADLGIDSIKRIEILGTFASSLPEAHARRLQEELDRLTRLRTLNAIAEASAAALDGVVTPADGLAPAPHPELPRFVMRSVVTPVPAAAASTPRGLHLVTEDAHGVARHVREALTACGAVACLVPVEALGDAARLHALVDGWRAAHGPVRGVMHLAAIGRAPVTGDVEAWLDEAAVTTRGLFLLLKPCADDLATGPDATVLAATALGGDFGRRQSRPGAEMAAGCHGLLRTFAREYPAVSTLVVDVDDERAPEMIAADLLREYQAPSAREVGYPEGVRITAEVVAAPLDDRTNDARVVPQAGWVVLATGGARGITAEVCEELAAPGVRFILVGRRVPGGGADPDEECRRTVEALEARGAVVEFARADVADGAAFGAVIDGVYLRHGRLDAVLHGAGVIEDQRFELKTAEVFDRVFATKVAGAVTIARHVRAEGLKWVVLFGSVSGRFGNPGQADYAAANEVLNRLAWSLGRAWPAARVTTINWGPWRGRGMASDAAVALMASRGITAIAVPDGRRFVMRELVAGLRTEAIVVAGDGPWRADARAETADQDARVRE
ncbi:MAG: SDR family NAD(P)-dependent oxidoreductase, partial [Vicinamibacterales bacterium]|nr:SDR family NAD(P)-dependent oxidoreductase [Vicinamibacterales bacterium]